KTLLAPKGLAPRQPVPPANHSTKCRTSPNFFWHASLPPACPCPRQARVPWICASAQKNMPNLKTGSRDSHQTTPGHGSDLVPVRRCPPNAGRSNASGNSAQNSSNNSTSGLSSLAAPRTAPPPPNSLPPGDAATAPPANSLSAPPLWH